MLHTLAYRKHLRTYREIQKVCVLSKLKRNVKAHGLFGRSADHESGATWQLIKQVLPPSFKLVPVNVGRQLALAQKMRMSVEEWLGGQMSRYA